MTSDPIVTLERWRIAQRNEKEFWDGMKGRDAILKELAHRNFQREFGIRKELLDSVLSQRVLEIGPGPMPLTCEFENCEKIVVDSLADYFCTNFETDRGIEWMKGLAETLPFINDSFEFVVASNVLDHVRVPQEVLSEIHRVLKVNGSVYLVLNCYGPLTRIYKMMLEKIGQSDPYHPHVFTIKRAKKLLENTGLELLSNAKEIENRKEAINQLLPNSEDKKPKGIKFRISRIIKSILSLMEGNDPGKRSSAVCMIFVLKKFA